MMLMSLHGMLMLTLSGGLTHQKVLLDTITPLHNDAAAKAAQRPAFRKSSLCSCCKIKYKITDRSCDCFKNLICRFIPLLCDSTATSQNFKTTDS